MDAIIIDVWRDARSQSDLHYVRDLPWDGQIETIFEWLTGSNARRHYIAIEIVRQIGKDATSLLLREALVAGWPDRQRIRLLQAIERVGQPLDIPDCFSLQTVVQQYGPAVQEQIGRVLAAHWRALHVNHLTVTQAGELIDHPESVMAGGNHNRLNQLWGA